MTSIEILERARTDRRDLISWPRLKQAIAGQSLDGVVAVSPANITYTGGINWSDRAQSTGTAYVVTCADGRQGAVMNEADAYYMREYSWIKDVRVVRYARTKLEMVEEALRLFDDLLNDMGLSHAKLGIEMFEVSAGNYRALEQRQPKVTFVDGTDVFEYARLIKTPFEIELIRVAAYTTDKAIHTAYSLTKPGDTEKTVAYLMQSSILAMGADLLTNNSEVVAGARGAIAHVWPIERPVQAGEIIHSDFGGLFGGYCSDMSRMAVMIRPSAKQEKIYRILWETQQRILEQMRPGVTAGNLFEIGRRNMERGGLVHAWGTLGHSTGVAIMEGFDIAHESIAVLEPGMIINVEPSLLEPSDGRYTIEDTVLVTETGIERLSDFTNTESMFVIR